MTLDELEAQLRPAFLAGLAGDAAAYRFFLDHVSARLRAYLRQLLARAGRADPGETEDVLQETLLALHVSQHTYDPAGPVTAWAHAIARHKAVDHLRRSGRHTGGVPIDDVTHLLAAPEAVSNDARIDLAKAMADTPERTRKLIEQVKMQGYSVAEAASAAGMTETAAKVAIHRGLRALARALTKPPRR